MKRRADVTRWDELALERVNEMVSRKTVQGEDTCLTQVYLKKGALVPLHEHAREQMVYVLQGSLRWAGVSQTDGALEADMVVREGEVLRIPARLGHQAEAIEDTFLIAVLALGSS